MPFVHPLATRSGRPLCLPFLRFGHRSARAGVEACPYRTSLEIWNACSTTNPLRRGGPPRPSVQGNQTNSVHRILLMSFGYPMATRRGRPLGLPYCPFGHHGAWAGVEAWPYRTSLEIWNACSTTNPLRRGGPLCPPAQEKQADSVQRILLIPFAYPMAIRSGRHQCLPLWHGGHRYHGAPCSPATTGVISHQVDSAHTIHPVQI